MNEKDWLLRPILIDLFRRTVGDKIIILERSIYYRRELYHASQKDRSTDG